MSNQLPSREQAIEFLKKNKCSPEVISHCRAVAEISLKLAKRLKEKGFKVDLKLVEAGALLHDIGRSKTNAVDHGVVGAQIASAEGLPEAVIDIVKSHVGGGFTADEAVQLGWPKDTYMPVTLEEKIVSYADKLVDGSKHRQVPIEVEIEKLQAAGHKEAAERVRKLHEEIARMLSD